MPDQRDLFGRPMPSSSSTAPSARPPSHMFDGASQAKMEAFRKLKPICVQLMGMATQQPTATSRHAGLIDSLRAMAETLPPAAFTPSLINYLLFPLTTTLRQASAPASLPDTFLEAAFRLLALVVRHWRAVPGGMDVAAWEQLWRLAVSVVGPRTGKGKERETGQEVLLDALELLTALLEPHTEDGVTHPSPAMRRAVMGSKSPLMPTLFQTITLAVDCANPSPPHPSLQRAAVQLVRTAVGYLGGQSEVLAAVLPGVVSAMTKDILAGGKTLKGDVAAEMTGAVQDVVTQTLDDETLRRLGVLRPQFNNLSELAEEYNGADGPREDETADVPSPAPSEPSKPNPFPPLTRSYLEFTAARLQSTLPPVLATLTKHASDLARRAASGLAYALVAQCEESLPRLTAPSLSTLLLLSQDDFVPVRDDALHKLHTLLKDDNSGIDLALLDLLSSAINSLPRLIRSEQDTKVDEVARLVTAIARITSATQRHPNAIAQLLGPTGAVERWAWALLDCLEFGRPRGWSSTAASSAQRTAELGWTGGMVSSSAPLQIEAREGTGQHGGSTSTTAPAYPQLRLRHVESEHSARTLGSMLEALGAAGGEPAFYAIDYFIRFARAHRASDAAKAVSSVWVVDRLLTGVASAHEGETRPPKPLRKMAREVARVLVAMDDEDDEDVEWDGAGAMDDPADAEALVPVERTQGVDTLTTLLDHTPRNSSAAEETRRLHARAQRVLLSAISLSTIASTAHILGTGFRPLLLHALYGVLAHLSSPHDLVRTYAEITLARIANDTGYASAQNLVLDNVDYVINVVSQRLTYHRLSPHAPLVLIAMIRLVGAPIVPLVHDVVDEIFDALDDFHGYSALASALLAVLTTLIDVMASETRAAGPTAERAAAMAEARRILDPPQPAKDFAHFAAWYGARSSRAQAEVSEILERAPRRAWGEDKDKDAMDEDAPATSQQDEEKPASREQEVAAQILAKATYYLSHASPFLRARVLALIAHAVPVLSQSGREGDLLPLIDRAWPTILARLDDAVPYVVVEAAEVVASLAEYVGDYVSRRVADDAWPRMLRLLRSQADADKRSALARRGGAPGTTSEYTVSHRLYLALVQTGKFIAAEVPVKDAVLWDMMLAFRPLLDARAHDQIQDRAVELYSALAARDADALWIALASTTGTLDGDHGVWAYLRDPGLDIAANAARALQAGDGGGDADADVELDLADIIEPDAVASDKEEYALDGDDPALGLD